MNRPDLVGVIEESLLSLRACSEKEEKPERRLTRLFLKNRARESFLNSSLSFVSFPFAPISLPDGLNIAIPQQLNGTSLIMLVTSVSGDRTSEWPVSAPVPFLHRGL